VKGGYAVLRFTFLICTTFLRFVFSFFPFSFSSFLFFFLSSIFISLFSFYLTDVVGGHVLLLLGSSLIVC